MVFFCKFPYYLSFQSFSKTDTQSRLLWFYVSAYSSLFLPSHFLVYPPTLYMPTVFHFLPLPKSYITNSPNPHFSTLSFTIPLNFFLNPLLSILNPTNIHNPIKPSNSFQNLQLWKMKILRLNLYKYNPVQSLLQEP